MLAPPQARGYLGCVIWKAVVSGFVASTLALAPAAAVACATSCVDHGGSHGSLQAGGGHVHHGAAATTAPAYATITGAAHACDNHDRMATPPTTVEREGRSDPSSTVAGTLVSPAASFRPIPPLPPSGTAHGPPGTQAATTVSVLRI